MALLHTLTHWILEVFTKKIPTLPQYQQFLSKPQINGLAVDPNPKHQLGHSLPVILTPQFHFIWYNAIKKIVHESFNVLHHLTKLLHRILYLQCNGFVENNIMHIEHSSLYAFQLTQILSFATNINQPQNIYIFPPSSIN